MRKKNTFITIAVCSGKNGSKICWNKKASHQQTFHSNISFHIFHCEFRADSITAKQILIKELLISHNLICFCAGAPCSLHHSFTLVTCIQSRSEGTKTRAKPRKSFSYSGHNSKTLLRSRNLLLVPKPHSLQDFLFGKSRSYMHIINLIRFAWSIYVLFFHTKIQFSLQSLRHHRYQF